MTKLLTVFVVLTITCQIANGQGTWTQVADFTGGDRWEAVGFSIGSKGYFSIGGVGVGSSYVSDLWEYDTISNTWTQKADFPGPAGETTSFVIGNKAYIGGGNGFASNTFWEYDQTTDIWTERTPWGYWVGDHSAFTIGDKGYICGGWGIESYTDLMEYDPTTDTWSQKADFPSGQSRAAAVAFTIGNYAYMGTGATETVSATKDFYRYDPSLDTWTQIADFGGSPRREAVAFTINDRGYVGTGVKNDGANVTLYKDFWEYNPSTDSWTQVADLPINARCVAATFSIGNKGFVGTGGDGSGISYHDFWQYTPSTLNTGIEDFSNQFKVSINPNPFSLLTTLRTDKVLRGATLTLYNSLGQQVRQVSNIKPSNVSRNPTYPAPTLTSLANVN
jgi:N-acetylneuraminic acid mutarotase